MYRSFLLLLFAGLLYLPGHAQTAPVINSRRIAVNNLLWDVKALSQPPQMQWVRQDSVVQSLLYNSLAYNGQPTQVFAYYSDPDVIAGRPHSGKKFPGVVLIHGGGGKAFAEWVAKWANEGYAAIAMDLAGKDGNGNTLAQPGPDQSTENKFLYFNPGEVKKTWSYYAVADVLLAHSLLLSFPQVDTHRTGVTGISWGGYLTCMAAGLDNRFKAAVPVYGCGFYGESDVFKLPLSRLKDLDRKIWLHYYDPAVYLPFAAMPVLFINGNKDKFYNVAPYDKTYRLVPAAQRWVCIKADMKHNHPDGWAPVEIKLFFEQVFNQQPPLLRIKGIKEKRDSLQLTYTSAVPLTVAMFYYTNEVNVANENRQWKAVTAYINTAKNTVACVKPAEGFRYGFFQVTDERGACMSGEFILHALPKPPAHH